MRISPRPKHWHNPEVVLGEALWAFERIVLREVFDFSLTLTLGVVHRVSGTGPIGCLMKSVLGLERGSNIKVFAAHRKSPDNACDQMVVNRPFGLIHFSVHSQESEHTLLVRVKNASFEYSIGYQSKEPMGPKSHQL